MAAWMDLDTPALLLDIDIAEANIERMGAFFRGKRVGLRPHAKTVKCAILAHKQLRAGAHGITCAKLGEAEVLVAGGLPDILVANQIVGPTKTARLCAIARHAQMTVAVDDAANVFELSAAATAHGVTLGVLVEVNVGMNRCGVAPGEPATALAKIVATQPGLRFRGLMGYEGHCVLIPDAERREAECRQAMSLLREAVESVEASGLPIECVSAGGTGTYQITASMPFVTEIQAGSYVFMDARYGPLVQEFGCALTVLTTVISRPNVTTIIGDCGWKGITQEFGLPEVLDVPGVKVVKLNEEHYKIELAEPNTRIRQGDKIRLLPSHCDTTLNLYDTYHVIRGDQMEAVWPITGRGKCQ